MASRCRSFTKPALNFLKSSISNKPKLSSPPQLPRSFTTSSRLPSELGCIQSLLPLHSAISSARLTSCLGISNSRSLSQGMLSRANPGHKHTKKVLGRTRQTLQNIQSSGKK